MAFEFRKRTSLAEAGLVRQSDSDQGKFTLTPVFASPAIAGLVVWLDRRLESESDSVVDRSLRDS